MSKFWRQLKDILTLNFWFEISEKRTPKWVKDKTEAFYNRCSVRPYNQVMFMKGNRHVYKVWFETLGEGDIRERYFVKRRTR